MALRELRTPAPSFFFSCLERFGFPESRFLNWRGVHSLEGACDCAIVIPSTALFGGVIFTATQKRNMFICLMLRLYCAATFRLSPVEPGGCFCNRNVNQTLIAAANACCGTHQDGCNTSVALQRICTKAGVLHFPPRHNYRIGGVTAVYHDSSRVVETERRTTVPQKRTHHFDSRNSNTQQKPGISVAAAKSPSWACP